MRAEPAQVLKRGPKNSENCEIGRIICQIMNTQHLVFGPFEFSAENGCLLRENRPVAIGARGASLLAVLLAADGRVVAKSALMDAVWPGLAVEESNLSVQIAALRKLLGPAPDGGDWIITVPRVGYRFSGPVESRTDGPGRRRAGGGEIRPCDCSTAFRESRRRCRETIPGRRYRRRPDHGARPVPMVPRRVAWGELRRTEWLEGPEGYRARTWR